PWAHRATHPPGRSAGSACEHPVVARRDRSLLLPGAPDRVSEPVMQRVSGQTHLDGEMRERVERRRELRVEQTLGEIRTLGDFRALPLPRDDHAITLELEVRTLHGDHRYAQLRRQLPDGGERVTRWPVAQRDALLDLLYDLQVNRPGIGLRDDE